MNQRSKRARDRRRGQELGDVTMSTGGHVTAHRRGEDARVRTPQKATGDVPADRMSGLAKASPFFKKVKEALKPRTEEEEKKVLAEATEEEVKPTKGQKRAQKTEDTQEETGD